MKNASDIRYMFDQFLEKTTISSNPLRDEDKSKLSCIGDLIVPQIPEHLFRLRAYSKRAYRAFKNNQIWLTAPYRFNDPYDCVMRVDKNALLRSIDYSLSEDGLMDLASSIHVLKPSLTPSISNSDLRYNEILDNISSKSLEEIRGHKMNLDNLKDSLTKQCKREIEFYLDSFSHIPKIACFTENVNSMLMWSHYANSHNGFALSYDLREVCSKQFNHVHDATISLFPTIYSQKRYDGTRLIDEMLAKKVWEQLSVDYKEVYDRLVWIKSNVYKSVDWKYENEWRMIYTNSKQTNDYCKLPFAIKPTAIYYGIKLGVKQQEKLSKIAKLLKINEYKMYIDSQSNEYELNVRKLID